MLGIPLVQRLPLSPPPNPQVWRLQRVTRHETEACRKEYVMPTPNAMAPLARSDTITSLEVGTVHAKGEPADQSKMM